MSKIKENIANNISELRKINKMTQQDLADKLNYTDKAISKWERGESTPDIESLMEIAKLFNITIDDLLNDTFNKEKSLLEEKHKLQKRYAKTALVVITFWLIGTCIFVYNIINHSEIKGLWLCFIWPIPISFLFLLATALAKKYHKIAPIFASGFLWTTLASIFLQMLVAGENMWIIFAIGIPIQLIIIITYWINN